MKILLAACNAKFIHTNLALHELYSYAAPYQEEIGIREFTINQTEDEVLREIYREHPQVICFSCYIWNIHFVLRLACDLVKILPGAAIWCGGPEVSYNARKVLEENPFLKGIMRGEGERTFLELCRHYLERSIPLSGIAGITYRDEVSRKLSGVGCAAPQEAGTGCKSTQGAGKGCKSPQEAGKDRASLQEEEAGPEYRGRILENPDRDVMDLSDVPFPYKDPGAFRNKILYYESSRGCPFRCSYCLSSVDKKLRFRDLSLVEKELQFFLDHRVPQVKFVDRTFNCEKQHAKTIWRYILEHDNGVTNFHFEISADLVDEEELGIFRKMRPGLIQLEIGVQSTNPQTIRAIRRTMDFSGVSRVVQKIRSFRNIHQHLDLIAGLPYEDLASFRKSFNEVYALRPDQLQLGFLKVLTGSYMAECTEEYRIVYKACEPYEVLSTRWLSYEDILELKTVENMVEIYYNSGQFRKTLEYTEAWFENPYAFYRELGEFYSRKGYDILSHSRIRRYEILLEFLMKKNSGEENGIRDCLCQDLYLREKLKSRPDFICTGKETERQKRDFMKKAGIPPTAHVECLLGGQVLLFDYEDRDPLSHNARVRDIT
ncbi:MAG: DUF4080 domain-containing protein, partial [Blautia sp.]|nr:DUF4080 domain-containing protein [Blautia sp.]